MNWRTIFLLSLFGLAMGVATVFFIGSNVEPGLWLLIFLFCAWVIARQTSGRRFLHGVLLGLANSVWITAAHIVFFQQYLSTHAREAEMMKSTPLSDSPRLMMAITGPVVGLVSGVVIGLLALVAGKFVKPAAAGRAVSGGA